MFYSKYKKIIIGLIILVVLFGGIYYAFSHKKSANVTEAVITKEAVDLAAKVGLIMELPKEQPSIATIVNESKIRNEPFFSGAKNGDKILVFTQAKKLVIYRPSTNKIVNIATIPTAKK